MLEGCQLPGNVAVTGLAGRREDPRDMVHTGSGAIIALVTGKARLGFKRIGSSRIVCMAGLARQSEMCSRQGEIRAGVNGETIYFAK